MFAYYAPFYGSGFEGSYYPTQREQDEVPHSLPPMYLNRLERFDPLNTAYQALCANDHIFERGAPVLASRQEVNILPTGNHGSAHRQYILSPNQVDGGGVGPANLAREASRTTNHSEFDNPYSTYAASNQDPSDQFLSFRPPRTPHLDDIQIPSPIEYTHQQAPNVWNEGNAYHTMTRTCPDQGISFASPTPYGGHFLLDQYSRPVSSIAQALNVNGTIAQPDQAFHFSNGTHLQRPVGPFGNLYRHNNNPSVPASTNLDNQPTEDNDPDNKYASKPDFTGLTLDRPNQLDDYPPVVDEVDDNIPVNPERPVTPAKSHLPLQAPIESTQANTPAPVGPQCAAGGKSKTRRRGRKTVQRVKDATRFVTHNLTKAIKFTTKEAKEQYEKNRRIGTCFLCRRRAHKQSCPYKGDDRVCEACIRRYGKARAAELCFQYHHEQLTPCNFVQWCEFHEDLQNLVPFWPNNAEDLSMYFAVGSMGAARTYTIGVDMLPTPGDNEQIIFNSAQVLDFIASLVPSLPLDLVLSEEERVLVYEAQSCIGLFVLIDQYRNLKYCSAKDKLELGRHVIHGFLRTLLDQYSQRTATLIQRSYDWLMEPRNVRKRPDVVVTALAVLYLLCKKQASWECGGRLGATMDCLQKRASLAALQLRKFGNAAYDLMDDPFKNRAPPGGFEGFAHTILPGLPSHEIHVTCEISQPNETPNFSPAWLNGPKMINVCFERLLEYQGNFEDLDNLKRFLLSGTPFSSPTPAFRKPFPPAIQSYITDNNNPPFLPSPRHSVSTIPRVGTNSSLMDLSGGVDIPAAVSPPKDKGKARAIDNCQSDDCSERGGEIVFRLQESPEVEQVLLASITTENPRWGSSSSGPSPSGPSFSGPSFSDPYRVTHSNGDE